MAFASTITERSIFGNKAFSWGTFTNASGDTGGDIDTGLTTCEAIFLQAGGSSVIATAATVNETLPVAGSAVTIVTDDNEDGTWFAFGNR